MYYEHFVLERLSSQYNATNRETQSSLSAQALALFDQKKRSLEISEKIRIRIPDPADPTVYDLSMTKDEVDVMLEQAYSAFFNRMRVKAAVLKDTRKTKARVCIVLSGGSVFQPYVRQTCVIYLMICQLL